MILEFQGSSVKKKRPKYSANVSPSDRHPSDGSFTQSGEYLPHIHVGKIILDDASDSSVEYFTPPEQLDDVLHCSHHSHRSESRCAFCEHGRSEVCHSHSGSSASTIMMRTSLETVKHDSHTSSRTCSAGSAASGRVSSSYAEEESLRRK